MFGRIGKFLAKRVLPIIAANIRWRSQTVSKKDGYYITFRVTVFGFELLDRERKISSQTPSSITRKEVIRLEEPLDIVEDVGIQESISRMSDQARKDLNEVVKQTNK